MPDPRSALRERTRDAILALPEPTRSVYLAHLLYDEDYAAIGAREGLGIRDVERHMARAIVLIDRHLRSSFNEAR